MVFTGSVLLVIGLVAGFSSIDLPGTGSPGVPGSGGGEDVPMCDVNTEIIVDTGGDDLFQLIDINEDSFYLESGESPPWRLSIVGPNLHQSAMSFATAENVRMVFTLEGENIEGQIEKIEHLGDIGAVTPESRTVEFSQGNLPPGDYELNHLLLWSEGEEEHLETFTLESDCSTEVGF